MGREEFALLDGERADGKVDGRTFLEEQERLEQRNGVFAAGEGDCDTVAVANHTETADGLPYFAQQRLF